MAAMDDGELDFTNQGGLDFSIPDMTGDELFPGSCSMENIFSDFFKETDTACTHNHICNPPSGPDSAHRHTCIHVHTKILSSNASEEGKAGTTDDTAESGDKNSSKKRPLGNREAVRKYREKKKARAASLEDEVIRLRAVNQQLMKRLQGQAVLETEAARLKCLLVDIRGRIEGEIGSFPYQKPGNLGFHNPNMTSAYVMNPCNMQCDDQIYCLQRGNDGKHGDGVAMNGQGYNGCEFENLHCFTSQDGGSMGISGCDLENVMLEFNDSLSGKKKRKGGARAAAAN